jgi:hypothetical protein
MKTKYGINNLKINTNIENQYLTEKQAKRDVLLSPSMKASVKSALSPPKNNNSQHAYIYPNNEIGRRIDANVALSKFNSNTGQRSNSRCGSTTGYRRIDLETESKKIASNNLGLSPQSANIKMLKGVKTPSASKFTPLSTRHNSNEYLGVDYLGEPSTITPSNTNNPEVISVMSLLGQNHSPLSLKNLTFQVPGFESTKHSVKSMNVIKAYAANTHQGIVR